MNRASVYLCRYGRLSFVVGWNQPGIRFGDRHQLTRTGRTSPYSTGHGFAQW